MNFKTELTQKGDVILRDANCPDKDDFLMVIPKESLPQLINELIGCSDRKHLLCLDGFRTGDDFKNALKQLRPDWFHHAIDCTGTEQCKVTTEQIKP